MDYTYKQSSHRYEIVIVYIFRVYLNQSIIVAHSRIMLNPIRKVNVPRDVNVCMG
jgi:hypothetical protein